MSAVPLSIPSSDSSGRAWHWFIADNEESAIRVVGWAANRVLRGRYGRVVDRVWQEQVQEVVRRVVSGAARFDPSVGVSAFGFLCGVHRRIAQERERRRARDESLDRLEVHWSLVRDDVEDDPAEAASRREALEALSRIVANLSADDQDLLRRRFSYPAPLEVDSTWSSGERVRLCRLLKRLRDLMADYA